MSTLLTDLRYTTRGLLQRPGFTLVILITLALGIGATTAVFSVVDAVLLRPLAYPAAEDLVMVWERNVPRDREQNVVAGANFLAWRAASTSFEGLAAFMPWGATLSGEGSPERVQAAVVTPGFFSLLRSEPLLGRRFLASEGEDGNGSVVLLGYDLWQRRFGGDPAVVGQTVTVNGAAQTVVGVMPRGFRLPEVKSSFGSLEEAEIFAPLTLRDEYTGRFLLVLGRLAADTTLEQAQTEMTAIAQRLEAAHDYNQGWSVNVVPLHEQVVGHLRTALLVILGAVGLVLAIACVNVANLLLARATVRRREIAIRTALGAGRGRLTALIMMESLLLALAGGGLGLLLAIWGVDLLVALAPDDLPRLGEVSVDERALLFTAAAALLASLFFGLAPIFQATRGRLRDSLRAGGRGTEGNAGQRLRRVLVVAEVALALMLLLGSGLLIRSFLHLMDVSPGFEAQNVTSLKISLSSSAYPEDHQVVDFYQRLIDRVTAQPGIESAAAAMTQPFDGMGIGTSFLVEGVPDPGKRDRPVADVRPVTGGYFQTLGIPLLAGRSFDDRDRPREDGHRTAIVSETLVHSFWPDGDALGKTVYVSLDGMTPYEIVGVVGNIKHMGLDTTPRAMIYLPHAQFTVRGMALVVRSSGDTALVSSAVREAVAALDPDLPVHSVTTMEGLVAGSVAGERFHMWLLGVFAAVALVLAAVGLYGLLAYMVSQRTHEIGIRLALGAGRQAVLGLVVRQALGLTLAGLVIGLAGALGLARLMASLLFEVSTTDPLTYGTVALVLVAVGLAASFLPARKASRVDPIVALRHE